MKIITLAEFSAALERAESLMDTIGAAEATELLKLALAIEEYEAPWFEEECHDPR